jgi:small subunit ribosomal protein S10
MIESLEISLKSFESKLVQNAVDQILSSLSSKSSLQFFQISFPQKQKRFTVLRSPHVHKKSREQFHVQSFKTMIHFSHSKDSTESEKYELLLFFENLKYLKLLGVQMKVQVCYTTFLEPNLKP